MIPGLSGSLLSHDALAAAIPEALGIDINTAGGPAVLRRVRAWHGRVRNELGPASPVRTVFDRVAAPLVEALGFDIALSPVHERGVFRAGLSYGGTDLATLIVSGWGRDPGAAWRDAVRFGIGSGLRWCLCVTGPSLRVIDARRTYSRRFIEFDLNATIDEPRAFAILWGLLRAEAFTGLKAGAPALLDRAVHLSEQHRTDVRASLQDGVHTALLELLGAFDARRRPAPHTRHDPTVLDASLTIVYRVLFLLFAEARGLVPSWHPTYRHSYTIEALRPAVERQPKPRGLWEALQAIARLAHHGCEAGTLRVPPFNGRLFSPAYTPLAESARLDDGAIRRVLLALTTRRGAAGRVRIAYGDLGVEQLGGVYERILDFEPAAAVGPSHAVSLVPAGHRKTTGSFYTPRSLTEFVVRRTIAPLVQHATPEQILALRVLDPAMGSGAFLVAACRYLAAAYEAALVRDGSCTEGDLDASDRAGFRRAIAQRCLFGVDVNPMAVQLGRLSLWLATLASDRPLTFLDHHLRTGNSLIGARLDHISRPPRSRARPPVEPRPLLDLLAADGAIGATVGSRLTMSRDGGDTIHDVRSKERTLASLLGDAAPLAGWKAVADLWCAAWFGEAPRQQTARGPGYSALVDEILGRGGVLPPHVSRACLADAKAAAAREKFFHWPLEFPEVFYGEDGHQLDSPGFDVVIGNPPWEVLRGDRGDEPARRRASERWARLTLFTRTSGIYRLQGTGHANLFQLFLERALSLTRAGGRLGMILPSGFASDHGSAALRRHALDRCNIDTFVSLENKDAWFPIHRGLKFLTVTATGGAPTTALPCRFGVRSPDALEAMPDVGGDESSVVVSRSLIEQVTADQHAIPELRSLADLRLVERLSFAIPCLGGPDGWHAKFGRELNATDDRGCFVPNGPRALPVVEGKQLQPFTVDVGTSRLFVPARVADRLLGPAHPHRRARLAYRDVAASTNRLTLIAAIVPANVVTTHTLFCLKGDADEAAQLFLCGIFNSFVANYLVRLRVGTHVTVNIIERLPVPRPARDSRVFADVTAMSARLAANPSDRASHDRLQALAAQLYGLTAAEFRHVLDTFPLVPAHDRDAAFEAFVDGV